LKTKKKAKASAQSPAPSQSGKVDYAAVRKDIAALLDDMNYDDGSYGPVFVRLAWHAAGTYCKQTKTGGTNGATMRFHPESSDEANNGLDIARKRLEKVKAKYPNLSYGDLWTLAGVVAIEEMGGPKVEWHSGRTDAQDGKSCPPVGRLPDAEKGAQHIRDVFYRMGFNDQEIVALIGAHVLGRCHKSRSGYDGPWSRSNTTFSNDFYKVLLNEKWTARKWNGKMQLENSSSGSDLMMLPADMAFLFDDNFKKYVQIYANDQVRFFNDFSKAFTKLLELGCPFANQKSLWQRIFG